MSHEKHLTLTCLLYPLIEENEKEKNTSSEQKSTPSEQILFVTSITADALVEEAGGFFAAFAMGTESPPIETSCVKFASVRDFKEDNQKLNGYSMVVIDEVHEMYSGNQNADCDDRNISYFSITARLTGTVKLVLTGTAIVRGIRDVFFLGTLLRFDFSDFRDAETVFLNECANKVDALFMKDANDDQKNVDDYVEPGTR